MKTAALPLALVIAVCAAGRQKKAIQQPNGDSSSTQQTTASEAPSLADTQKWIKNTFAENSGQSLCHEFDSRLRQPEPEYGEEFACLIESYDLVLDGCKVTFYTFHSHRRYSLVPPVPAAAAQKWNNGDDKVRDFVAEFNLGDIDPKTIQVSEPWGTYGKLDKETYHPNLPQVYISLATTNNEDTIAIAFPYGVSHGEQYKIHELGGIGYHNFVTIQPDYAPRFVKALTHAAELCGGKTFCVLNRNSPLHRYTKYRGKNVKPPRYNPIKLRGDGPTASEIILRDRECRLTHHQRRPWVPPLIPQKQRILNPPRRTQRADLLIRKHPRPDQEAHALAVLQREHPAAPRNHIQRQLRVLPVFELAPAHEKRRRRRCNPIVASCTSLSPVMNSPSGKHIGETPSQQPPDW